MPSQDDFDSQLESALAHRPVIEQAKGALAALRRATPDQAFAELRWVSMTHNVKLHALADALVQAVSGRAPTDARTEAAVEREWGPLLPPRSSRVGKGSAGTRNSA